MNEQAIDIVIRAKDEASKAISKISWSAQGLWSVLQTVWKISTVAFAWLTAVIYKWKQAIEEDAQATFRLTKLLKTASKATDEQVASLVAQAEALEKSTVAWYDMIATTQSQLATFNLQAESIQKLTPAIIDYVVAEKWATASAEDYRNMTNGLAQALNGNFASLTRSGFVLDEHTKNIIKNGTEAQKTEAIYKVLSSTYKGFAEDATQTAIWQQIQLWKAMEDVSKEIASFAIPIIDEFRSRILLLTTATLQWIQENRDKIQEYITFFIDWFTQLGNEVLPYIQEILTTISEFWREHGETIKIIVGNFIQITRSIIVNWLSIISGVIKTVLAILSGDWKWAWNGIRQVIVWVWDFILDYIDAVFNTDIRTAIGNGLIAIQKAFTETWKWLSEGFTNMVKSAKEWGWNMIQMFIDWVREKVEALKEWIVQIATTIKDYLGFSSPTKKWPWSNADKWMPNLINMLAIWLEDGRTKIESKSLEIAKTLTSIGTKFKTSDIANTLVSIADKAKEWFTWVTDNIQASVDKIKNLRAELEGINDQIRNLSTQRAGTEKEWKQALAERAIEIEKEIASIKADQQALESAEWQARLKKLQDELSFADTFLTTQEKAFALQQMNRSESQVILDNMWKKMGELDMEILKQQELASKKKIAIAEEEALQKTLIQTKIELENEYYALFKQNIEWVKKGISEAIALMRELNSLDRWRWGSVLSWARATGWSVNSWEPYLVWERWPEIVIPKSASTVVPNNQIAWSTNISINFWGVSVRNDSDIRAISKAVEDSLTRKLQLYRQGIS